MRRDIAIPWVLALAALLAGGTAVHLLSAAMTPHKDAAPPSLTYLPGRRFLKLSSFGFDRAVADALWIRSIQYFNEECRKPPVPGEKRAPLLAPLGEAITDLDPHFHGAYYYCALFLRIVRRPEEALALLEKGEALHPRAFLYPSEIGNMAYIDLRDAELPERLKGPGLRTWRDFGVDAYKRAALTEDVQPWFPRFFEAVLSGRGEFEAVLEFYRLQHSRAPTRELRAYWLEQVRYALAFQLLLLCRQISSRRLAESGAPPSPEDLAALPGLAHFRLRVAGRLGDFTVLRSGKFFVDPVGVFRETLLYDPQAGPPLVLHLVRASDRQLKEVYLRRAVANYLRSKGVLPPAGSRGVAALVEAHCLRNPVLHPLGGGYVLDAAGNPVSERGWEEELERLEE